MRRLDEDYRYTANPRRFENFKDMTSPYDNMNFVFDIVSYDDGTQWARDTFWGDNVFKIDEKNIDRFRPLYHKTRDKVVPREVAELYDNDDVAVVRNRNRMSEDSTLYVMKEGVAPHPELVNYFVDNAIRIRRYDIERMTQEIEKLEAIDRKAPTDEDIKLIGQLG